VPLVNLFVTSHIPHKLLFLSSRDYRFDSGNLSNEMLALLTKIN